MEDSHSSGHKSDSTHGESHLAKVQAEHISSPDTCGQPAEISAMKVFSALPCGLGTCTDCPGWKSDREQGDAALGSVPMRCQPNVA